MYSQGEYSVYSCKFNTSCFSAVSMLSLKSALGLFLNTKQLFW